MPEQKKRVVICGITGTQGGWVYEALKDDQNYDLVGFSRRSGGGHNDKFPKAQMFQADLTNLESLKKFFEGADYVFGVTQPWSADYKTVDVDSEILQGKNIIQVCLDCKIQHLVFSSATHDGVKTGIPHVDSKIEIEKIIASSGLSYTILHPVQFADNVGSDFFPIQANGWIRGFVDADAKVPYVACRDIGLATKAVLDEQSTSNSQQHAGKIIKLIGDVVSGQELAAIVTKLRGTEFKYYCPIPHLVMRLFAKEFYAMRISFEKFGRNTEEQAKAKDDIKSLKLLVPELSSMEDHLKREGWATRELISAEEIKKQSEQRKKMALCTTAIIGAGVAVAFALRKRRN